MSVDKIYAEKELSWLSFNERVLQEAADKSVPLIERIRFLGIFSNNFDEFYKVRFADIKRHILIETDPKQSERFKRLLSKIQKKAQKLSERFDVLYNELMIEMARRRIFLVDETQLTEAQESWIKKYFHKQIIPHITPILFNDRVDVLQFLKDEYAYLAVELSHKKKSHQYALLEIPTDHLPRFVTLPEAKGKGRKTIILIDNIMRYCINDLFKGYIEYDKIRCFSFKMTRDADYGLRQEVEYSLIEQMSHGISQRLTAMPVRFIYEKEMPKQMLDYLCQKLKISHYDSLTAGGRYQNFKDFMGFPNLGAPYLENKPLPPLKCADFFGFDNAFDAIKDKDILLHYPYHNFNHITELVRQASFDPRVFSIKINIYRIAQDSRLMNSLIDAVNNGKNVTVVVELQARFDEEANIEWSKLLTDAGVNVMFGVPGLKIHAKLLLISRQEKEGVTHYAHIGTGNFHEKTAKIYTDLSLLTANAQLSHEVKDVFGYIENPYRPFKFNHLIVSPNNCRKKLYQLIDNEINNALMGHEAKITLKMNNLVDKGMINKLYEANRAGVQIRMIIRGMCALIPHVVGLSENIYIISIVDRFLEHPRVFVTHNNGSPLVYISSADWMTRNIENRIEVATPIFDERLKQRILKLLDIQFTDTVKARIIDKEMSNAYVARGNRKKLRSQIAIYEYIKQLEKETKKQKLTLLNEANAQGSTNE